MYKIRNNYYFYIDLVKAIKYLPIIFNVNNIMQ